MTWDDVRNVDDLVPEHERGLIDALKKERPELVCPYLRQQGVRFFYCSRLVSEGRALAFEPNNPIVRARQGSVELQLFCRSEEYTQCINYTPE